MSRVDYIKMRLDQAYSNNNRWMIAHYIKLLKQMEEH